MKWLRAITIEWVAVLVCGAFYAIVAMALFGLVLVACSAAVSQATAPTAAERAASRARAREELQRKVDAEFDSYLQKCGDAPYPSWKCPAWDYDFEPMEVEDTDAGPRGGEIRSLGSVEILVTARDEVMQERDEYPCLPNQVKLDSWAGFYYMPGSRVYAAMRGTDVYCVDDSDAAWDAGYRPSPR